MNELIKELLYFVFERPPREWEVTSTLDAERPTVVLVSGFTATARELSILRKRLIRDGFNVRMFSLDWTETRGQLTGGLVGMAEKLLQLMSSVIEQMRGDRSRVFLVAHSAGGLVARYFVQRMGGGHYCATLITLATPHQGTWVALLGVFSPLIRKIRCLLQLLPISGFIKKINRFPLPRGISLVSIYSRKDVLCTPRTTKLPVHWEKSDWVEVHELSELSHSDFLIRRKSYEVLLKILKEQLQPGALFEGSDSKVS